MDSITPERQQGEVEWFHLKRACSSLSVKMGIWRSLELVFMRLDQKVILASLAASGLLGGTGARR